jgi:hypothetical protein
MCLLSLCGDWIHSNQSLPPEDPNVIPKNEIVIPAHAGIQDVEQDPDRQKSSLDTGSSPA